MFSAPGRFEDGLEEEKELSNVLCPDNHPWVYGKVLAHS